MVSTTVVREAGSGNDARGQDRTTSLRLGQLLVLAAGVVLVLVVAGMLHELVTHLMQDVAAGTSAAPTAATP